MKISELKYKVQETGSFFFTRKTMAFFGDTMANYGVISVIINTHFQKNVKCWELYRKKTVKHGLNASAYFNQETFKREFKEVK